MRENWTNGAWVLGMDEPCQITGVAAGAGVVHLMDASGDTKVLEFCHVSDMCFSSAVQASAYAETRGQIMAEREQAIAEATHDAERAMRGLDWCFKVRRKVRRVLPDDLPLPGGLGGAGVPNGEELV